MYTIIATNSFKKDIIKCKKRGYNIELLENVIINLQQKGTLEQKYKPHKLIGNFYIIGKHI